MTVTPDVSGSRRTIAVKLVAVGLGGLAALVLAEILVRLLCPYNTPETVRRHSLQYLPSVFGRHRLTPNQDVETAGAWGPPRRGEPDGPSFRINERGTRGAPIAIPKPPGTVRLLVLGGSSAFDIRASDGRDWPHRLQEILRNDGHPEVEVVNAGVPGHTTADALGRFYSQLWMLEPDYVLVYQAWNDLKYMGGLDADHPLISVIATYDPSADPFQNYLGRFDRLLGYSQLYIKLRNRYFIHALQPGVEGLAPPSGERSGPTDLGLRQFRLDLELLVDASRDVGATPILATEATLVAAGNGPAERARIHYEYQGLDHDRLVRAFQDCYRMIEEVGREKHVPVLDVAGRLNGHPEYFDDQVHTTERGSEALAVAFAAFFKREMDQSRSAP